MKTDDFVRDLAAAKYAGLSLTVTKANAKSVLEDCQHSDLLWGGGRRQRAMKWFGERVGGELIAALRSLVASGSAEFDGVTMEIQP